MSTIKRLGTGTRMSQAVVHGDTVYLAGQVASNRELDAQGQTAEVLVKIDALLKEAGTDRLRILTATVWLADINDFDVMNTEWDAWVPPGAAPARACVESHLAKPDIKVEVQVVAAL